MASHHLDLEELRFIIDTGCVEVNKERNDPHGMDADGYQPLRLSSAGGCAAALALKATTKGNRDVDPIGSRIFELGHQRGESLFRAIKLGLEGVVMSGEDSVTLKGEMPVRMRIGKGSDPVKLAVLAAHFPGMVGDVEFVRGPDGKATSASNHLYAKGHPDVFAQSKDFDRVIEIKTMNPYVIKKVEEGSIGTVSESYQTQLACYQQSLVEMGETTWERLMPGLFLLEDKANCAHKLVEMPHDHAKMLVERAKARFASVVKYMADVLVDNGLADKLSTDHLREQAPDMKGKLPWMCNYCDVVERCWGARLKPSMGGKRIPDRFVTPEMPDGPIELQDGTVL